jgi:hypothetical protein
VRSSRKTIVALGRVFAGEMKTICGLLRGEQLGRCEIDPQWEKSICEWIRAQSCALSIETLRASFGERDGKVQKRSSDNGLQTEAQHFLDASATFLSSFEPR